jgi:hypothetical protein
LRPKTAPLPMKKKKTVLPEVKEVIRVHDISESKSHTIIDEINKYCQKRSGSRKVFLSWNLDSDGVLSFHDLESSLTSAGIAYDAEDLRFLVQAVSRNETMGLEYRDFIKMLCINHDNDSNMKYAGPGSDCRPSSKVNKEIEVSHDIKDASAGQSSSQSHRSHGGRHTAEDILNTFKRKYSTKRSLREVFRVSLV